MVDTPGSNPRRINRVKESPANGRGFLYIANDFNNVYKYLMDRLREANMTKDKEILEEVNGHIRTMRDTWKEVMRLAK